MTSNYLRIATTPSVAAAQDHYGSLGQWARMCDRGRSDEAPQNEHLGPSEQAFIAARDGFYLASVSETGWPYVQYRGGPAGFLKVVDETRLGYADFRGNRQYITTGNVRANDRVSLFIMDHAHRRRLKIFGHMRVIDAEDDPALREVLAVPGYLGHIERLVLIAVEAFDWNCPQHITPRFTAAELQAVLAPLRDELEALRRENGRLRGDGHSHTSARDGAPETPEE